MPAPKKDTRYIPPLYAISHAYIEENFPIPFGKLDMESFPTIKIADEVLAADVTAGEATGQGQN